MALKNSDLVSLNFQITATDFAEALNERKHSLAFFLRYSIKISNTTLQSTVHFWIVFFLDNRSKKVVQDQESTPMPVGSGVPLGSFGSSACSYFLYSGLLIYMEHPY